MTTWPAVRWSGGNLTGGDTAARIGEGATFGQPYWNNYCWHVLRGQNGNFKKYIWSCTSPRRVLNIVCVVPLVGHYKVISGHLGGDFSHRLFPSLFLRLLWRIRETCDISDFRTDDNLTEGWQCFYGFGEGQFLDRWQCNLWTEDNLSFGLRTI